LKMCYKKTDGCVNQSIILVRIWSDRADMAKGLAPIFFTTCGVVVAGIIGYAIINPSDRDSKPTVIVSETTVDEDDAAATETLNSDVVQEETQQAVEEKAETTAEETASLKPDNASNEKPVTAPQKDAGLEDEVKNQTDKPVTGVVKPSFDVVRVERDGSAVIAGRAAGNQKIELVDGDRKIADATTGGSGEFVIVLDTPLTPGTHELFIRTVPESGEAIQSSSFAFVEVPEKNSIGSATVLLAELGKPSQIIQKPESGSEPEPVNVVSNTAQESVSVVAPDQQEVGQKKPEQVEEQETQTALVNPDKETPESEQTRQVKPVLLEAADVENGKIFIAGTGEPGGVVNLYMDNELLGSTEIGENGAFLFEGQKVIEAGRYEIRADMTDGVSPQVIARAEVDLVHEPQAVAVKEDNEPEDVATLKAKPAIEPEVKIEGETAGTEDALATPDESKDENKSENAVTIASKTDGEPDNSEQETTAKAETDDSAQKEEIRTGSAVIIRRGDNLWTVARRNYGAGIRYTTIFEANRDQIRNPHKIYPGQVLKVPETQ